MRDLDDVNEQLFSAVQQGDVASARALLAGGADARYIGHVQTGEGDVSKLPLLFVACKAHNRDLAALLLEHGADPNARAYSEWTIPDADRWELRCWSRTTCLSAAMPSLDLVSLLLAHRANPNLPSEREDESLHRAHAIKDAGDNAEIEALLRQHGGALSRMLPTEDEVARKQAASGKRQKKRK